MFFFLRPASSLDLALDAQHNMKQCNKMHFIQISFCYKIQKFVEETMCCIGFGPSHDVLQELLEVEQCRRRLEDEETNSHELST